MLLRNKNPRITLGVASLFFVVGLVGIRFFTYPIGEDASFFEGFKTAFFSALLSASAALNIIAMFRMRKQRQTGE